jgi:hypothetical protein
MACQSTNTALECQDQSFCIAGQNNEHLFKWARGWAVTTNWTISWSCLENGVYSSRGCSPEVLVFLSIIISNQLPPALFNSLRRSSRLSSQPAGNNEQRHVHWAAASSPALQTPNVDASTKYENGICRAVTFADQRLHAD